MMSEITQQISETERQITSTLYSLESYQDTGNNLAAQFMLQMQLANLEAELARLQALEQRTISFETYQHA